MQIQQHFSVWIYVHSDIFHKVMSALKIVKMVMQIHS